MCDWRTAAAPVSVFTWYLGVVSYAGITASLAIASVGLSMANTPYSFISSSLTFPIHSVWCLLLERQGNQAICMVPGLALLVVCERLRPHYDSTTSSD